MRKPADCPVFDGFRALDPSEVVPGSYKMVYLGDNPICKERRPDPYHQNDDYGYAGHTLEVTWKNGLPTCYHVYVPTKTRHDPEGLPLP